MTDTERTLQEFVAELRMLERSYEDERGVCQESVAFHHAAKWLEHLDALEVERDELKAANRRLAAANRRLADDITNAKAEAYERAAQRLEREAERQQRLTGTLDNHATCTLICAARDVRALSKEDKTND